MLLQAAEFYIWAILSVICALACSGEPGRCPLDCCNTVPSYLSLNCGAGCQNGVPVSEDVCCGPGLFSFPSTVYGGRSNEYSSWTGDSDVNRGNFGAKSWHSSRQVGNVSWSSTGFMFHSTDGGCLACALNLRELGDHQNSCFSVNNTDQIIFPSCRGYLLFKGEMGFRSQNMEIENSLPLDTLSPCVSISPNRLEWGQNYIYHPAVVFLILKNICNDNPIEVYEPFSTNPQFYPFNYSKVVLGPGEVASISFVFLPKWLGSSSAELVLQTSLGGFLVQATGVGIESPHKPGPLAGLGVSSGGWLSRKLSITNPFNETIHLEEVTVLLSVTGSGGTLLAEAFCREQNHLNFHGRLFSDTSKELNDSDEQVDPVAMSVRPLTNWVISPHRTESILEVAFSPCSEGKVLGSIYMQLLRPVEGKRVSIVVPFEAFLNKTVKCQDTSAPLSVSIEAVRCSDANETTVSVSVVNNGSRLLKIVDVREDANSRKLLKINYVEGILLFPGSVTQVVLVTFRSSDVDDLSVQMPDLNLSCALQLDANDSSISYLEVSCKEIFEFCSRRQLKLQPHLPRSADLSNRIGSVVSTEESSVLSKGLHNAPVDEFVLQKWKSQSSMSGLYILDHHELLFPLVLVDKYLSKPITVKNPTQHPVIVQLILDPKETVGNCKPQCSNLLPAWASNLMHHEASVPSRYGFSMMENSVTEAFLEPNGTASLGPIWFHPSNRCEWNSSAFIRNNLSGVEQLLLRGFGGGVSLVLLEGSELMHKLQFMMNLPSLNMSSAVDTFYLKDAHSDCRKPHLKKLSVLNAGDVPVEIEKIKVSGTDCGLDGFLVHNCKELYLGPGESLELGVSYQTDFSGILIQRELEFKLAAGIFVVPMQADLPITMLNLCMESFFWVRVKRWCVGLVITAVLMFLFLIVIPQLMPSASVGYITEGDKKIISMVRQQGKIKAVPCNKGNGKTLKSAKVNHLISCQTGEAGSRRDYSDSQHGPLKERIVDKKVDRRSETTVSSDSMRETKFSISTSKSVEPESTGKVEVSAPVCLTVRTCKDKKRRLRKRNGGPSGLMALTDVSSSQSGNSTPTSPLSPITTPSPKEKCSSSPGKSRHHNSSRPLTCEKSKVAVLNPFNPKTEALARTPGNCSDNMFSIQQQPFSARSTGSKPMFSSSATFPGTGRSTAAVPSPPPRLAISPHARAPGPKVQPRKTVQAEEKASPEDRFTYNIWGNHLCGLDILRSLDNSSAMTSKSIIQGHSDSFFVRSPQQLLMTNSGLTSVSSSREGG